MTPRRKRAPAAAGRALHAAAATFGVLLASSGAAAWAWGETAGDPPRPAFSGGPSERERVRARRRALKRRGAQSAVGRGREGTPRRVQLPAGRWDPAVRRALEEIIARRGNTAPGYTETNPPAAVLVLDDVSVIGHCGEATFYRMVDKAEFKFNRNFWEMVPPPYGPAAERGRKAFRDLPPALWAADPNYQAYRKAMAAAYEYSCARLGGRACRSWFGRLLAGLNEVEVVGVTRAAVEEGLQAPVAIREIAGSAADDRPVRARTGLRTIPEMAELYAALSRHGFNVWVFSSSNFWAAQAIAAYYGVDPSRVVAVRNRVVNQMLQPDLIDPIPVGIGQSEAVTIHIGSSIDLAIGGGLEDKDLLERTGGVRVLIDRGNADFQGEARSKGWLIQPAFAPGPPEMLK